MSSCSRDENHVKLSHCNHTCGDSTKIVFSIDSVTDVKSTIADAHKIDIVIILGLTLQIVLNRHLDGLVWLTLQDNAWFNTGATSFANFCFDSFGVNSWLNNCNCGQMIVIGNDSKCLLHDLHGAITSIKENSEAEIRFVRMHIGVFADCNCDRLLSEILYCSARNRKVTMTQ